MLAIFVEAFELEVAIYEPRRADLHSLARVHHHLEDSNLQNDVRADLEHHHHNHTHFVELECH